MTTQHTPGPWEINGDQYVESLSLDTPLSICMLADCGEATESNGALIAAAPDLLDALRDLVAVTEQTYDNRHELAAALDAIERATGGAA